MSLRSKLIFRFYRILIEFKSLLSGLIEVLEGHNTEDLVDSGIILVNHFYLDSQLKSKYLGKLLHELKRDIKKKYSLNNGRINSEQMYLLCLYLRESQKLKTNHNYELPNNTKRHYQL